MIMIGNARVLTIASWNGLAAAEAEARERVAGRGADPEARDDREHGDLDAPLAASPMTPSESRKKLIESSREVRREQVLRVVVDGVEGGERARA